MLYQIAKYHDVTLTAEECAKIITACGSSILGYLGGSKFLNFLLNLIPGVGTFFLGGGDGGKCYLQWILYICRR